MKHLPYYKASALPGKIEGVSGSYVVSTNVAINKYIDEDRKIAAIEFMKFLSLKDSQKKYIINNDLYSAATELYKDEEVCSVIECEVVKDAYPFSLMNNDPKLFGDDNYNSIYRDTLFDYLYEDKPVTEVLKKIDDVTKIYEFSLSTEDSNSGLIIFIIFLILVICMILSLIFIFIKNLEKRFQFLSKDLWVITTLGSLILMCSILTLYGEVNNTKCHIRMTLINIGLILSICPSLLKLIKNFSTTNKISLWFDKNKYISILAVMIFTGCLNGIFAISSYDLQDLKTSDGLNFRKCKMNDTFGNIMYYFIQFYEIFVILISLLLIFMEWNFEETSLDVKYLATAFFMDILLLIILNILNKVKFNNYVIYNALLAISTLFFSLSNHLFSYFVRVLPIVNNNDFEDSRKILGKVEYASSKKVSIVNSSCNNSKYSENTTTTTTTTSTTTSGSNHSKKASGITQKIINYHNRKSVIMN